MKKSAIIIIQTYVRKTKRKVQLIIYNVVRCTAFYVQVEYNRSDCYSNSLVQMEQITNLFFNRICSSDIHEI